MVSANRKAAARWDTVIVTGEGSWVWQGNLCMYDSDVGLRYDLEYWQDHATRWCAWRGNQGVLSRYDSIVVCLNLWGNGMLWQILQ